MPSKRKTLEDESPADTASLPSISSVPGPSATPAAPPKRQRVSRACDQCRAAREKCDGIQPTCHACVSQGRTCTYQANPKKRGVQTGYIRTLEVVLAWTFDNVPGSEEALGQLLAQGQGNNLLSGRDKAGNDHLHRRWRKSRIHKGIERVLSGGGPSQSPDKMSPSDEASDTETDIPIIQEKENAVQRVSRTTPHSPESLAAPASSLRLGISNPESSEQAMPMPLANGTSKLRLKLPPDHTRLLDIYLAYTQSWLPITDKKDFWQTRYAYHGDCCDVSLGDELTAAHAELWSALALASFQEAANASRSPGTSTPEAIHPDQIYRTARSLVPSEDGPFQVQHVRALLLLGLVNLGRDNLSSARILVGTAIRIFLDLRDLSSNEEKTSTEPMSRQRLQSTFIGCFVLDTVVSTLCDKTPHLKAEDLAEAMPISSDNNDEWEPWKSCEGFGPDLSRAENGPRRAVSSFNQLYAILKILSTVKSAAGLAARATSIDNLRQIIVPGPHLQDFITTTSSNPDPAPVPSLYVLRVVYLWALMITDPSPLYLQRIVETISQFEARFGTCASPPIFSTCLSSLATSAQGHPDHALDTRELLFGVKSLKIRLTWIWAVQDQRSTHRELSNLTQNVSRDNTSAFQELSGPTQGAFHDGSLASTSIRIRTESRPANPSILLSAPTSSVYYNSPTSPPQHRPSTSRSYPPPEPPPVILAAGMPASKKLLDHSSITDMTQGGNPLNSSTIMGTPVLNPGPQQHYHQRHLPMARGNFTGSTAEIDSYADEFHIDYMDRADCDARFFTNLGFPPGSNLEEILARGGFDSMS